MQGQGRSPLSPALSREGRGSRSPAGHATLSAGDARPYRVIHLQPEAPDKPAYGAPCNGCGVCCAHAPCPLGIVASRRTQGACAALVWEADAKVYRCGLIVQPERWLPGPLRRAAPLLARLARRYIAAGKGCDAHLETEKE